MRTLIAGILMIAFFVTNAQKVLVVEKIGRGRYFSYMEGDMIHLETKKGPFHIQEEIVQIDDTSILVKGNYRISFDNISYIEKFYKRRRNNGILLTIAGGALVGIISINNALQNKPVLDPLYLTIGAGLASAGGLWYSLGKRKYRIGKKWKLKVLDSF